MIHGFFKQQFVKNVLFIRFNLVLATSLFLSVGTNAQVIPDSSLGNKSSVVIPNQTVNGIPSDKVFGGAIRGANLFHSFQEFNIKAGRGVYFNNPQGIQNILARVTGNRFSSIYGNLGVLGGADLFFLNPNGVVFGPNARLNLNGSFLASSADYIKFDDGKRFGTRFVDSVPTLTISTPDTLGFTGNPGSIEVQGSGHTFKLPAQFLTLSPLDTNLMGLTVKPGNTISLIGGEIIFKGAVVTAPSGNIEIGSIISGEIDIRKNTSFNTKSNHVDQPTQGNILFSKLSLLDASGFRNGNIRIFGNNVTFTDASLALIQNFGSVPLGAINIASQNVLTILGDTKLTAQLSPFTLPEKGLITNAFADGQAASINIQTKILNVDFAGRILARAVSTGRGGDLNITALESTLISGNSPFSPFFPLGSVVATASAGNNDAGDLTLSSPRLSIKEGGQLSSAVFGNADGGDIVINSETINLSGFNLISLTPSIISASTSGQGKGGNLLINTKELILRNGGRVDASTLASGSAGSVTINSQDLVSVSGTIPGAVNPSLIISSANIVDPSIQEGLRLPPVPSGESGSVTIKTSRFEVFDGAEVTVRNDGPNNAGQLVVVANDIRAFNGGSISGSTNGGNGGDIFLSANLLLLQDGLVSASALKQGKGGSITINTDLVVALEKSNISANAQNAQGGQIRINTLGLFLSPDSTLTATSQLGPQFDGSVDVEAEITEFSRDPNLNIQSEPPELYASCGPSYRDTLAYYRVGTGGQPVNPATLTDSSSQWLKVAKARYDQRQLTYADPKTGEHKPLKRVVGWKTNENGTVSFVNDPREADQFASAIASTLQACQPDQTAKAG